MLPHSALPEIQWPALPGAAASLRLALQFQLEQTQWWPAERLLERQLQQAGQVLSHAYATVPWYRERLRAAGLRPKRFPGPAQWSALPILTRGEVQAAGERLRSTALPPTHGQTRPIETSGSTGRPISVLGTDVTALFWQAFTLRDYLWHRRDLGLTLAAIRAARAGGGAPPHGTRATGWGSAAESVYRTGPGALLSITATMAQQVAWLRAQDPDYLLTYPSNLRELARRFAAGGRRLGRLREVSTVGEVVDPGLRALVRQVWGVPLVDMYTSQEAGYLALQCPQAEHYHVQCENVLLEVLDERGAPCAPGQAGRVVVTTLHNFATPLIRYEIGDYAEPGPPCPCGRGLPVLERIMGRVRNMLTLPDGNRRWPYLGENVYRAVAPVERYQIVQESLETVSVRLVVSRPLTGEEERTLARVITGELGHPFALRFSYPDDLPRGPGGKFEDFRSELDPPAA